MDVSSTIKKFGLEQAFKYLYKDPDKNMVKIMNWADTFAKNEFAVQRKVIREAITNFLLMRLWSAGRNSRSVGKSTDAIFRGRFFWILRALAICTVQAAGPRSMGTS